MAYFYWMVIDCGSDQNASSAVAQHFAEFPLQLASGFRTSCEIYNHIQLADGSWFVKVYPRGAKLGGEITEELSPEVITEIAALLYQRLKSCPTFRYALANWEATVLEFPSGLNPADLNDPHYEGLVLSQSLWEQYGKPERYRLFSDGYVWKPYVPREGWG